MFSRALKWLVHGGLSIVLCLSLVACGSKLTQENFDKVKAGMTMEEVKAILGEPSETNSVGLGPLSGTSATWKDEKATISIQFVNNKVTMRNFNKGR
jgi:hypothetical protein